jgi:uncharacterized protein YndB with AHSA1/START domain
VSVSVEVTVDRSPAEVFGYLADGERLPEWMEEFDYVRGGPPGPGASYRYRMRRGAESTFEYSEYEPPRRVAWTGPAVRAGPGSLAPNGSFTVEPADGASRVRVELDPRPGGLFRLLLPLLRRSMRASAVQDLARLKAQLERSR